MLVPGNLPLDDPSGYVLDALVSYWSVTTAAGNAGGTTLVCAALANDPSYVNLLVKILSGPAAGQVRQITADAAGVVTVNAGFTDSAGAAQQILAGTLFVILSIDTASAAAVAGKTNVQEVVIYPVAEDRATTELADDGSSPAYLPAAAHSTAANAEANPGVAWTEDIDFEQQGTITVISIYVEFEWQTRFLVGGGAGTQSSSKIQMSRDGGANWVDVTDNFSHGAAVMTSRVRAGVGRWLPTIVAGANQLQFRLVHWTNDGGGVSTSEAQIRSNSFARITYRKS